MINKLKYIQYTDYLICKLQKHFCLNTMISENLLSNLTSAFMAPALKLWGQFGLFSLAMYTKVGSRFPSSSTAFVSLPSTKIWAKTELKRLYINRIWNQNRRKKITCSTSNISTCTIEWWSFFFTLRIHSANPLCCFLVSSWIYLVSTADSIRFFISSYNFFTKMSK